MGDGQNQLKEGEFWYWHDEKTGDGEPVFRSSAHDSEKLIACRKLNFFIGKNNSGKSQFLRRLFVGIDAPKLFNSKVRSCVIDEIGIKVAENLKMGGAVEKIDPSGSRTRLGQPLQTYLTEVAQAKDPRKNRPALKDAFDQITYIGNRYEHYCRNAHYRFSNYTDPILQPLKQLEDQLDESLAIVEKSYIPTMRGLRPTQPNDSNSKTPYADRTIKDYFDPEKQKAENVITGENLYIELTQALLGEPKQRESVRAYEQALSQYFFDGATISLIPKYGEDTINIKIGDDSQRSVTQLGDGLQQVLILTYEAFLKKDQRCAFFIEEPELHMHAGMLRQLMNFYLNETKHFYFFTTHSNHLVDMVDESSEVMIQKFQKKPKDAENPNGYFQIDQCDRDRDLLAQLGVRPSSVYLSNCTIWVEGITDRLYIHRYMQRYLQDLEATEPALYAMYQRFMPNYHYSFVEYQGAGIVHWNFDEEQETVITNDQGLDAHAACAAPLLVADGDVDKADRVSVLTNALGAKFQQLPCKEIENTLPTNLIIEVAKDLFDGMQQRTRKDADITRLDSITDDKHFFREMDGIGRLLDQQLNMQPVKVENKKTQQMETTEALCFSEKSGTIKNKLEFCRKITALMDSQEWQLTDSAKALCARIFQHIDMQNR